MAAKGGSLAHDGLRRSWQRMGMFMAAVGRLLQRRRLAGYGCGAAAVGRLRRRGGGWQATAAAVGNRRRRYGGAPVG
jgi:hypothetical protein